MEDRIVGNLSAYQFGILVIGGGLSFFLATSTTIPKPVNEILGGLMAVITVVMALGKFNDQPLFRFFRFIIAYITKPKIRVWHKKGTEVQLLKPSPYNSKTQTIHPVKNISKGDIARLAVVLDSRGSQGSLPSIPNPPTT